jgi:SAM-dependent methyltransferase
MAQNIYDRPDFFEGYSQLGRSVEGLAGAVEWPALRSMLPGLGGLRVVDLGCGFGWFCRWAREQGAAQVLGLDVSERMLTQAQNATMDSAITYKRGDLEEVDLPAAQFDLAYSSLALHYVEDLARLFAVIHRSLVPGGRLVFSTEHPIYMAPTSPGWSIDANGRKTWPIDSYLVEGPRTTDWLTQGVVKHHRTIGTTLNSLLRCGFSVDRVEEFCPTPEQIADKPELAQELHRPMFLLVAAQR